MTMNSIGTAMELFSYTGVSISLLTIEQTLVLTKELSRIMSAVIVNTAISIKSSVASRAAMTLGAGVCIGAFHFLQGISSEN